MSGKPSVTIHGIPTLYRGIRFRSRTEARWAVLFDELGWPWQFEPFDLNGYVPDFVLRFEEGPLLVEVKGHVIEPHALGEHTSKLEASGWDGEALIVGAAPWELDSAQPLIGWFGERDGDAEMLVEHVRRQTEELRRLRLLVASVGAFSPHAPPVTCLFGAEITGGGTEGEP
jgi:hypothetical protein